MSEWRTLNTCCTHCGKFLQARPKPQSIELKGCESMEYRHAHDHSKMCIVHHDAAPYSDWGKYNEWQNARASQETSEPCTYYDPATSARRGY